MLKNSLKEKFIIFEKDVKYLCKSVASQYVPHVIMITF